MRDKPLWLRLGLAFGAVSLVIVTLTLSGITLAAGIVQGRQACRDALGRARDLEATGVFETPPPEPLIRLRQVSGREQPTVFLVLADGRVVNGDGVAALLLPERPSIPDGCRIESIDSGRPSPSGRRLALAAVPLDEPGFAVALLVTQPVAPTSNVLIAGIPIGLAITLASFGLGAWVARRLTKPIDELRAVTGRIGAGELDAKVTERAPGELGVLADDVNRMSDALVEARRREQEFLANVSHELRTPITSVLGFAEALQDGTVNDPEGITRVAGIVHAEATRLQRLADDVLQIARIGAGAFPIEIRRVDVRPILDQVAEANRARADAAGVTLNVAGEAQLPVETDPERFAQVLTNLVTNAIRISGASTTVSLTAVAGERPSVSVRDEGPGIAASDLPHVFERAYLLRAGVTPNGEQHGLGLAIVRELCSRLGATIAVTSTLGAGTTFTIRFPTHLGSPG